MNLGCWQGAAANALLKPTVVAYVAKILLEFFLGDRTATSAKPKESALRGKETNLMWLAH